MSKVFQRHFFRKSGNKNFLFLGLEFPGEDTIFESFEKADYDSEDLNPRPLKYIPKRNLTSDVGNFIIRTNENGDELITKFYNEIRII